MAFYDNQPVYTYHHQQNAHLVQHSHQTPAYGAVNFNACDQAPTSSHWHARYNNDQNIAQPVPHPAESTLAHALDDLHVSFSHPQEQAPDPNTFYEYREVLRHPDERSEYEGHGNGAGPAAFQVADQVPCMDTAQVPCAEYGDSYCSDDDSPYGTLTSPVASYDAASPFTDVVDSPTTDFADLSYLQGSIHSPIHYNSHCFDRPVVPSRSYTLEQAVTLNAPQTPNFPARSPSVADTKRSASTSTSLSETTGSSSSSKASTPLSITSTSTNASSGSGKPRGRPRKRQNSDSFNNTHAPRVSPPRSVDYPYPKFDGNGKNVDNKKIAPKPEETANAPPPQLPVLSMDEIPIPDAESKPGQAIFKLNTPPEVKEKPKKKPILACLFCRERKIACGQPLPGSVKCNQCARRGLDCEFPKESRRGQHKRGPRAARVAALTEAALNAKRPLEPAVFPSGNNDVAGPSMASSAGITANSRVKVETTE